MNDINTVPPQDLEAEQAVLGACLQSRDAILTVTDTLAPDSFYRDAHQTIFMGIKALSAIPEPVDMRTLSEWLRKDGSLDRIGGGSYISTLYDCVPTTANVAYYAAIVAEKATLRSMMATCIQYAGLAQRCDAVPKELLPAFESAVLEIADLRGSEKVPKDAQARDSRQTLENGNEGVPWELATLNTLGGYMSDSYPNVLGALSSTGKTWFLLSETLPKLMRGEGVLGFSLEMPVAHIHQRLVAMYCAAKGHSVTVRGLRAGCRIPFTSWVKDGTYGAAWKGIEQDWPIEVEADAIYTVEQMASRARRVKRDMERAGTPLRLIWIDHAGLIEPSGGKSEYEKSKRIAGEIRQFAKQIRVPVLVASQVTEEQAYSKDATRFPNVHTQDAKAWFNHAGQVLWLHRPSVRRGVDAVTREAWKDKALVWMEKSRMEGGSGIVEVGWRSWACGFFDLDEHQSPKTVEQFGAKDEDGEPDYGDPFTD